MWNVALAGRVTSYEIDIKVVGVPYTVRSFIIYDNDVTLTLT